MKMHVTENGSNFVDWVFTPPNGAGWFDYKFEAKQENGVLYINFDKTMMMPRN